MIVGSSGNVKRQVFYKNICLFQNMNLKKINPDIKCFSSYNLSFWCVPKKPNRKLFQFYIHQNKSLPKSKDTNPKG